MDGQITGGRNIALIMDIMDTTNRTTWLTDSLPPRHRRTY